MMRVAVRIFHPEPEPAAGPLESWLGAARARLAQRHQAAFEAAGANDIRIEGGPPDGIPFGRRLRDVLPGLPAHGTRGLVVLGSGAIPLATRADYRRLVDAARGPAGTALANNRYSADVVAIAGLAALRDLPDAITDNALPRWLADAAGYAVTGLRARSRLGLDLDSPLDLVLTSLAAGRPTGGQTPAWAPEPPATAGLGPVLDRLGRIRAVAADPGAELVVVGRTSAATLSWLERHAAARVRALVEERGLKTGTADGRPPASVLGALLDRDGPDALGAILSRLGEAAILDTRVLLAHRLGRDERGWPAAEDRFASDLLLPGRVRDPWLRALTAAAAGAPIPVLLGGHSLVGPGLHLVVGPGT